MSADLWDDGFKGFAVTTDGFGWNMLVERCQFTSFVYCQAQQIHISDLNICDDRFGFDDLKDTNVLRPELMAWGITKPSKDVKYSHDITRPVWVTRMAGYTDESIFGDGAGRPRVPTLFSEPAMG